MDLKVYYRKVRETESQIATPFVVLYSLDTPEGGRCGRMAETARGVAARLIIEGRSRVASPEETNAFYRQQKEARRDAEAIASAQRMQVVVVPQAEVHAKRVKE
jgi:hypothetical protein